MDTDKWLIDISDKWLRDVAPDEQTGKQAQLPAGADRARYWDRSLKGYGVVVGKRFATFIYRARVGGVRRDITIGRWGLPGAGDDHGDLWTEPRARKEAKRKMGQVANHIDPVAERAASSGVGGPTLRDAMEAHLARMRKKNRADRSIATFENEMKKYLASWLDRPIADVTGAVLVELHEKIKAQARDKGRRNEANDKGAPLANRVITHVGAAWNSLNKKLEGKLGSWNPAKAVDKDVLKPKRERIPEGKMADWATRVEKMASAIRRDGLMFALYTGLRSEDVRTVRFENVDWKARTLRLPDPKGGESAAFDIPLSATPLAILKRRLKDNAHDLGADPAGWAFPGLDTEGEATAIGDLREQRHGDKHERYPAEDVHTLRRTWESIAHEEGVSELDQHVLSNHSFGSHNVNATYISQHIDHLAKCAAKIDAGIARRLKPKKARKG